MCKKKCKNPLCRCFFIPDRFNHYHHEYCEKKECKSVRDAVRKKRYREKNKHNEKFRRDEVKRVRKSKKARAAKLAQQDNKTPVTIASKPQNLYLAPQKPQLVIDVVFFQDCLRRQELIMAGFAAQTLDEIMPEVILSFLEGCWKRGKDLYRSCPTHPL